MLIDILGPGSAFAVASLLAVGCVGIQSSVAADAGADASAQSDASNPNVDGSAPGTFAWSTRAPLPLPRTDHGVAAIGGKVYAFGGYSGSMLARIDEYDPRAD